MAVNYMTTINISTYDPGIKNISYEYDETLTFVSVELTSNAIIMPNNIKSISCFLDLTTGSGKVQYSLNKIADIISGTSVVWKDWDAGSVSVDTDDVFYPVSAIRFVCSSGVARLFLKAQ